MPLQADDLEPGQFISILRGARIRRYWADEEFADEVGGNGGALVVLAVSLPFIVVGVLADPFGRRPEEDTRVTIDTRKVRLCRVSEDFVYALTKEPVDLSRWNKPRARAAVSGIKADPEIALCRWCGGPWPEHAKTCRDYKARRR
jgi:hypothetical protein